MEGEEVTDKNAADSPDDSCDDDPKEGPAEPEEGARKSRRKKRGAKKKFLARSVKGKKKSDSVKKVKDDIWDPMKIILPSTSASDPNSIAGPSNAPQIKEKPQVDFLNPVAEVAEDGGVKILHILSLDEEDQLYESVVHNSFTVEDFSLHEDLPDNDMEDVLEQELKLNTIDEMEEDPFCDIPQQKNVSNQAVLQTLLNYLKLTLPLEWNVDIRGKYLRMTFLNHQPNPTVTRAISYSMQGVEIFIHNRPLPETNFLWDSVKQMDPDNLGEVADHLTKLANLIEHSTVCSGVSCFKQLWNDSVRAGTAQLESLYGEKECLRHSGCALIILSDGSCSNCRRLKSNLKNRNWRHKHGNDTKQKFVNSKLLSKEELLQKASKLQAEKRARDKKIARLQKRIKHMVTQKSVNVSQSFSNDLNEIFQRNHNSMTEVQKLFWSEQMKALSKRKNPRTVRWNPFVIKLALHLQMISTSAYEYMQNFIKLPSLRTLYDFTHVVNSKDGPQDFILEDLMKQLPAEEHQQFFNLEFDEISLHADIVIKKSTGEVIGYTNLREVEVALAQVEAEVSKTEFVEKPATKALVYMAQGVTNSLIGVVGVYSTDCLSAGQLYSRTWEIIYNMEYRGLKVNCLICDGASMNKKFFKMHAQWVDEDHPKLPVVYATCNLASSERRPLYFVVDPPHLLKTLRNCLANSFAHKKSRKMWNQRENLSWKSIELLYELSKNDKFRKNKLTRNHINLSSHGCMKVIYASQTMSNSVVEDLKKYENDPRFEDHDLPQLCKFLKLTNDAFDCWNSCGDIKGKRNKENNLLQPYTSKTDPRFKFLQVDFLNFFHEWNLSVQNRRGNFKKADRDKMFISQQSYEALQISVHGFIGAIRFLFDKGATTIDGRKYNQDKLEQYFGIVRMSRGGSDNPNYSELRQGILSRHIQSNAARPAKRGNTEAAGEWIPDQRPLSKRKRK